MNRSAPLRCVWSRFLLPGIAFVLLCAVADVVPAGATDTDDAAAVVTRLQTGLLKLDRDNAQRNNAQRYTVFAPLIEDTHDLGYMARLSVARFWNSFSAEQRKSFEDAFRHLSVMGYAARFRDTAGNSFRIDEVRAVPGDRVEVATRLMSPPDAPISLNYVLHRDKGGWRIVNILAEGVSDLALQRSQYQQVMQSRGFDGLLAHLGDKSRELEIGQ